jgi:hypothetical protein
MRENLAPARRLCVGDLVITRRGSYVVIFGEENEHAIGLGIFFGNGVIPSRAKRVTTHAIHPGSSAIVRVIS